MSGGDWTTPTDLAEYAFCPRAHHYRRQGEAPRTHPADAGTAYHLRQLSAERLRDEHGQLAWIAVFVGLGLLTLAIMVLAR